jgi:SPP1 family predicted phage head-tail adaptor
VILTAAGRLVQQIEIQQRSRTQSATSGAIVDGWTTVATVRAELKPLNGRNVEIALARTKGRSSSHKVIMRYPGFDLVAGQNRFNFNGRIFELFDVDNLEERNLELDVICNEMTA